MESCRGQDGDVGGFHARGPLLDDNFAPPPSPLVLSLQFPILLVVAVYKRSLISTYKHLVIAAFTTPPKTFDYVDYC